MSDSTHSVLRDTAFLSAVFDTLVPPGGNRPMPGAGSIGIEAAVGDAITADPVTGSSLASGLEALREGSPGFAGASPAERTKLIEAQAERDPIWTRALLRHLYLAYYQHPTVLAALGEPARPPFPEGFEIEPTDPGLLAVLHARMK